MPHPQYTLMFDLGVGGLGNPQGHFNSSNNQYTELDHWICITTTTRVKMGPLYKDTPEMRMSPIIRTQSVVIRTLSVVQAT